MICPKNKCTGCFCCYNICPKQAIQMKEDEYGNVYPIIDEEKCIHCNLCKKTCPALNKEKLEFRYPTKVYAMYSKDKEIRSRSTSGGIATAISKFIIEKEGIVYGAGNIFNKESFEFCRIDSIDELYKIQGSKYVHCYVNDKYKKVKEDLENKKKVLFIGTPCQIAGLKMYLNKDYKLLLTIDIICHGVPSQKLLFENLKESYKIDKNDFDYITFRDSNGFHLKLYKSIEDYKSQKNFKSRYANLDQYYKNFLRGNIYRDNCYECSYAKKERISDITIGDFWGLSKDSSINDDIYKGISSVIINTEKGMELFDSIKQIFTYEERTYEEAYSNNEQLNNPMKRKKQYYIYKDNYISNGVVKTFRKMYLPKDYIKYNPIIYNLFKKEK